MTPCVVESLPSDVGDSSFLVESSNPPVLSCLYLLIFRMDNWGGNAGVLVADEDRVVIPVTAHLRLFGHGKCMAPKVRSLDGVARALLCMGLKPCMSCS